MDRSFVDITIEFLCVSFHSILYYTSLYPTSIFESRKKYGIVVKRSMHPEINQYIDSNLRNIAWCMITGELSCVEFALTDNEHKTKMKFVFQFDKNAYFVDTTDAYFIRLELNLRAFCLKLSSVRNHLEQVSNISTFNIFIHTNESTALGVITNPEFEEFPLVEVEESQEEIEKIIPLGRFSIRNHFIDTYLEFNTPP